MIQKKTLAYTLTTTASLPACFTQIITAVPIDMVTRVFNAVTWKWTVGPKPTWLANCNWQYVYNTKNSLFVIRRFKIFLKIINNQKPVHKLRVTSNQLNDLSNYWWLLMLIKAWKWLAYWQPVYSTQKYKNHNVHVSRINHSYFDCKQILPNQVHRMVFGILL